MIECERLLFKGRQQIHYAPGSIERQGRLACLSALASMVALRASFGYSFLFSRLIRAIHITTNILRQRDAGLRKCC